MHVGAALVLPLKLDSRLAGALSLSTRREGVEWPQELVGRAQLLGEALANCLAMQEAERRELEAQATATHAARVGSMGVFAASLVHELTQPVAVGDLIELGPLLGEIQRIGIRSSSVRTTHGAEVIVPNSDLASKEVINWTRSDRQRRYDIDVGVAYGSEPTLVMRLLEEAAREVPEVMVAPAPMAMFKGIGESSLDFRLLAWVSTIDLGLRAQSALRVAVLAKLDAAGIAIPFPQPEVHLVAAAESGPKAA